MAEMTLALGLLVGLVLGLTGAGGSILAVPALMIGLGWSLTEAAPVALLAVCIATAFGTITAWNVTYIRYRAAMLMAVAGLIAAPLGLHAAETAPTVLLSGLFSSVLVIVALRMLLQSRRRPDETLIVRADVHGDGVPAQGPICRLQENGRLKWTKPCAFVLSAIGSRPGSCQACLASAVASSSCPPCAPPQPFPCTQRWQPRSWPSL